MFITLFLYGSQSDDCNAFFPDGFSYFISLNSLSTAGLEPSADLGAVAAAEERVTQRLAVGWLPAASLLFGSGAASLGGSFFGCSRGRAGSRVGSSG
mgnify:CR=1 FL=1